MNVDIQDYQYRYEVKVSYKISSLAEGFHYCHSVFATVDKCSQTINIASTGELNSTGVLALEQCLIVCKQLVVGIHSIQVKEETNV